MEVLLSVSLLVFLCGGFPVYLSTRHESLMSTEKNAVASFYLRKAREDTKYLFYNLNQSFCMEDKSGCAYSLFCYLEKIKL